MVHAWGTSNDSADVPHRAAKVDTTSLGRSVPSRARCVRFSTVLQICPRYLNFAHPVPQIDAAAAPSTIVPTYVQVSKRQREMPHRKVSPTMEGKSNFLPLRLANRMRGIGERNLKIRSSNCWLLSSSGDSTSLFAKLSRKVANCRNAFLNVGDGTSSSVPMPWNGALQFKTHEGAGTRLPKTKPNAVECRLVVVWHLHRSNSGRKA